MRSRLVARLVVAVDVTVLVAALVAWNVHGSAAPSTRAAASRPGSSTTVYGTATTTLASPATATLPPLPGPPSAAIDHSSTSTTVAGPTTTVPEIVTSAGPASTPGPVSPTPPGSYVYTASGQSGRGSSTTTLTEKVANEPTTNGEIRQSVSDVSSDGSFDAHQEVSWRANGLYLRSLGLVFGGTTYTCAFTGPVQELALPLAVGKQWPIDGTCTVTFNGAQDTVKLHGSAKVSGIERVAVGGQAVNVWVVDASFDITGTGAFAFNSHETATRRLTADGVVVTDKSTMTNVPFAGTVSEERQLRSLKPS